MNNVEQLLQQGRIELFDIDVAKRMQDFPGFLGLFLSRAFRSGFMSVQIEKECTPSPEEIFLDENMNGLSPDVACFIEQKIIEEFHKKQFIEGKIEFSGNRVFFPYAKAVEEKFLSKISILSQAEPDISLDERRISTILDTEESFCALSDEQKNALRTLSSTACGFLTGGPGTGKTFTAGMWLKMLFQGSSVPLHIGLCAPTGRAAQTLAAYIKKAFGETFLLDVQTIHRLILSPFSYLPYNVLVVDECSMIDSMLFSKLLQKIRPGTRILFLGDKDQLPPVDAGQPFRLLLESLPDGAKSYALSHSHRTDSREILELARLFLRGETIPKIDGFSGAVRYVNVGGSGGAERLATLIKSDIVLPWEKVPSQADALNELKNTVLLTPTRVGPFGAEQLNNFVRSKRKKNTFIPVVFLKNNNELNVMNGDLGILEKTEPLEYIYTLGKKLPAAICPRFEEAYAMSVHKSQGSEFFRVILLIPPGIICSPNLLYTAATRARKELIVVTWDF